MLSAIRNVGIIQAFGSVEGVWLLSFAPGRMQNISEATFPSRSLCGQEVRLMTLPKMQFSLVRATCARCRRRGGRPRGVSVTAPPALPARPRPRPRRCAARQALCHPAATATRTQPQRRCERTRNKPRGRYYMASFKRCCQITVL